MTYPVAIGYALISSIALAASIAFGFVCLPAFVTGVPADSVHNVAAATMLLGFVALWAWMLIDHLLNGESEHAVLVSVLLVFGGGIAGIAYFFLVFRHRQLVPSSSSSATVRGGG